MTIPFTTRVKVAENVLIRELDEESVLLNLDSESYFGLDDVGTRMWKAVTTSDSIQHGFEVLAEEYDVETDELRRDLNALLEFFLVHRFALHPRLLLDYGNYSAYTVIFTVSSRKERGSR